MTVRNPQPPSLQRGGGRRGYIFRVAIFILVQGFAWLGIISLCAFVGRDEFGILGSDSQNWARLSMAGGYYYDIFNTAIYSALDRFDVVSSVLVRSLLSISMLAGISRASFKLHESFFRRDFLGDLELTLAARYQPSRGNGDFDRISSVASLAVEIWMLRARRPMLKTASDEVKSDPVIQNYINDIDIYCEGLIPADHLRSFVLTEADRSIPRTLRLVCLASIFLLNMIFMPVIAAAVVMVIKISTESDVF